MSSIQELPPPVPGPFSTTSVDPKPDMTETHEDRDITSAGKNRLTGRLENESEGWLPVEEPHASSHVRDEFEATRGGGTQNVLGHPQTPAMPEYTNRRSNSWHVISGRNMRPISEARSLPVSAFAGGAGTTGPHINAEDDAQRRSRIIEAQHHLRPAQKSRIAREESFNAERISTIIKKEGRSEKEALSVAISELEGLQKVQRSAIKNEARIQASHAKLLDEFKKSEASHLNAKRKYDISFASLKSEAETLDKLRESSRVATQRMQDKAAEVDTLRKILAVDNREREVKLEQLNGPRRSFWCF